MAWHEPKVYEDFNGTWVATIDFHPDFGQGERVASGRYETEQEARDDLHEWRDMYRSGYIDAWGRKR